MEFVLGLISAVGARVKRQQGSTQMPDRFFSEDERAELAAKWSGMTEQDLRIEYCRLEGEWLVADLKVSKILYKMNAIRLLLQHGRAKEKP